MEDIDLEDLVVKLIIFFPSESQRCPIIGFTKSLIQNLLKSIKKCPMAPICITSQMSAE